MMVEPGAERGLPADPFNLLITGVGGQGIVTASRLLAQVAWSDGYQVTVGETYGLSQRSGPVASHVRLSRHLQAPPQIPNGGAHTILGLEPLETIRVLEQFAQPESQVVLDPTPVFPIDVQSGTIPYPPVAQMLEAIQGLVKAVWVVQAQSLAQSHGLPQNLILVGALVGCGAFPAPPALLAEVIGQFFTGQHREAALRAYHLGLEQV